MLTEFRIAETEGFQKEIASPKLQKVYKKIKEFVYPQLRANPFFGPNIKKLKGELAGYYRYRIGNFRLFYKINQNEVIVIIVSLKARKEAYN